MVPLIVEPCLVCNCSRPPYLYQRLIMLIKFEFQLSKVNIWGRTVSDSVSVGIILLNGPQYPSLSGFGAAPLVRRRRYFVRNPVEQFSSFHSTLCQRLNERRGLPRARVWRPSMLNGYFSLTSSDMFGMMEKV